MSRYVLYVEGAATDHVTEGTSPARALRGLCDAAGLTLASQDGRYGRLKDGTSVVALTVPWSRVTYPDARTTRL